MQSRLNAILEDKGTAVHSIEPGATVHDAVRKMNEAKIGCLLVIDQGQVAGIFTERDVLSRILDKGRDPAEVRVADVMTTELVTVPPTITVEEAMGVITEKRCRHLPVMEGDTLLGMVSSGDLTRWTIRNQAFHIQDLVSYITRRYPV